MRPIKISYDALKKLVMKGYSISKENLPAYYPTIDDVDELLESKEFEDFQLREDAYKFFVMYLCCGFARDLAWHAKYPGHRYVTADNLIAYIMTPLTGDAALTPHVNTWDADTSEDEQEDRQALFEYLQGIVLDKRLYSIDKDYIKPIPAMSA